MAQGARDNEAAGATSASCQVHRTRRFSPSDAGPTERAAAWMPVRCQAGVFGVGTRRHIVVRPAGFVLFPHNLLFPSDPRLCPRASSPAREIFARTPKRSASGGAVPCRCRASVNPSRLSLSLSHESVATGAGGGAPALGEPGPAPARGASSQALATGHFARRLLHSLQHGAVAQPATRGCCTACNTGLRGLRRSPTRRQPVTRCCTACNTGLRGLRRRAASARRGGPPPPSRPMLAGQWPVATPSPHPPGS
jgi:hypothetical protein